MEPHVGDFEEAFGVKSVCGHTIWKSRKLKLCAGIRFGRQGSSNCVRAHDFEVTVVQTVCGHTISRRLEPKKAPGREWGVPPRRSSVAEIPGLKLLQLHLILFVEKCSKMEPAWSFKINEKLLKNHAWKHLLSALAFDFLWGYVFMHFEVILQ